METNKAQEEKESHDANTKYGVNEGASHGNTALKNYFGYCEGILIRSISRKRGSKYGVNEGASHGNTALKNNFGYCEGILIRSISRKRG
jgi:hypothetical protein